MVTLEPNAFVSFPNLIDLHITDSYALTTIQPRAFDHLLKLKVLDIKDCPKLFNISLGKFNGLEFLSIARSGLTSVPDFSSFRVSRSMIEISLSRNKIKEIPTDSFVGVRTDKLTLDNTDISRVHDDAFRSAAIRILQLRHNPNLVKLGDNAFTGIQTLETLFKAGHVPIIAEEWPGPLGNPPPSTSYGQLDLSGTMISTLPTAGLKQIVHLILERTEYLRRFPSIFQFDKIKTARLTYPHHCCLFQEPARQDPIKYEAYREFLKNQSVICRQEESMASTINFDDSTITVDPFNFNDFGSNIYRRRLLDAPKFGQIDDSISPPTGKPNVEDDYGFFIGDKNITKPRLFRCGDLVIDLYRNVTCTPQPDAFNPCEDVMGYEWLRVIVWFVLLSAIAGNVIVMFVICTSRHKMDVNKFLVCNLAFADFLMGLYLLLLASIDIQTLGEYFNFAIHWQTEGGCKAAGFLTIFSSQLSVYTLTVITLERWYAINNAIHLRKRLKLRQAVGFMCIGWLFAFVMALLPMVGISGYGNVSICLPMKVTNKWDLSYIILLLILNWLSFAVILACYVSMYYKVRSNTSVVNSAASKSDYTIAKRMALLVFTNVICFFPISFFGLTASAGFPLISITNSKILLVLFYPFNSCANPFLYAILTKQFRKDMFFMLSHHGLCTKQANKYKSTMSKSFSHASRNNMMLQNISPMSEEPHGLAEYRDVLTPNGDQLDITPHKSGDAKKKPLLTENLCNDIKGAEQLDIKKLSIVPESSLSSEVCEQIKISKHLCPTEPPYTDMADTVRSASDYAVKYSPEEGHAANKLQKLSSQNSNTASETDMSYISSELSRIIHQDSWPDKEEEEENDDILERRTENPTCLDVDLGYHSGRGTSPNYRTQIRGAEECAKLLNHKDSKKHLEIGDDRCLMDDEIADLGEQSPLY